jgi:hypothetical protein
MVHRELPRSVIGIKLDISINCCCAHAQSHPLLLGLTRVLDASLAKFDLLEDARSLCDALAEGKGEHWVGDCAEFRELGLEVGHCGFGALDVVDEVVRLG